MISRKNICSKLKIDSNILEEYLNFIAYPEPRANDFEFNVAQAIYKLHELLSQGFSLGEVRDLIHCSEKFCDVVPSLKEFLQLSESINLRETISSYHEIFEEFSSREDQYQERIQELESDLMVLKSHNDKAGLLEDQVSSLQGKFSNMRSQVNQKDLYISNLEMKISELEMENSELQYRLNDHLDELENLKTTLNSKQNLKKSAIDIEALLKKKEKEVSLKYQREILDLKKQVEFMLENQEQKWLRRNLSPQNSSK